MTESKTANAARKAVEKSEKKGKVERTSDQIISDIRKNLSAHLAVTPEDQRFLLAQYDEVLVKALASATDLVVAQGKLDEFRDVYEQENRSATLRVDVVDDSYNRPEPTVKGEVV